MITITSYKAIAEAGQSIIELLRVHMTPEPIKNKDMIALCSVSETDDITVRLILYDVQVIDKSFLHEKGNHLALCLRYILTVCSQASGEDCAIEEQILLGKAMQILHNFPVITSGAETPISICHENLNLENKLRFWESTVINGAIKPAVFYNVSPVIINELPAPDAPRVLQAVIGGSADVLSAERNN